MICLSRYIMFKELGLPVSHTSLVTRGSERENKPVKRLAGFVVFVVDGFGLISNGMMFVLRSRSHSERWMRFRKETL